MSKENKEKLFNKRFGERVKAERQARGWTQPYMAELLETHGIPMGVTTVTKIEGGSRPVRIVEAVGMADVFGVSVDALMGRGPSDDDLAFALRVLRDNARRSSGQALEDAYDIRGRHVTSSTTSTSTVPRICASSPMRPTDVSTARTRQSGSWSCTPSRC